MEIILIAALDNNNIIGHKNYLLCNLPNDLKHFKDLTLYHTIIMGRKTFESINRPLSYRDNIVITRNHNYSYPGIKINTSLKNAIYSIRNKKKIFIIGGGEIYKQTIDIAHTLEITRIYYNFIGDIKFPEINLKKWYKISEVVYLKDKNHLYNYSFITYKNIFNQ